jgi:hypothetical protein
VRSRARGVPLAQLPLTKISSGLWGLILAGCAADAASRGEASALGVGHFKRPPGMPIGTGADGGALVARAGALTVDALEPPPAEVTASADLDQAPAPEADTAARAARVPCAGCLELNVHVDDINQRDEFVFPGNGVRVTRVVWTILVNFNSDQLAVQPFVNDKYGKYTSLHVNTFPLGKPVQVEQEFKGKADIVGLVVGSSGAWTGNQTMSVFVDAVSIEGPGGFTKSFAVSDEGVVPRTEKHRPKTVLHPE